jgi:hypothetical protein
MSGAGQQGAGLTPAGLGDLSGSGVTGFLFKSPTTGESLDCRKIDPRTKRYVFGEDGRIQGMTSAQQNVYLAVSTDLGSSAVREIGNTLKTIKTIGRAFENQLRQVYVNALSRLVNAGHIELVSIEPQRFGTTGAFVLVRWRDLSSKQIQTTEVRS